MGSVFCSLSRPVLWLGSNESKQILICPCIQSDDLHTHFLSNPAPISHLCQKWSRGDMTCPKREAASTPCTARPGQHLRPLSKLFHGSIMVPTETTKSKGSGSRHNFNNWSPGRILFLPASVDLELSTTSRRNSLPLVSQTPLSLFFLSWLLASPRRRVSP